MAGFDDEAEQLALVRSPLGEPWSGRARYAAAMYFFEAGKMSAEVLEVYRISARLDHQDPLTIIRERGIGTDWLKSVEDYPSVRLG